MTPLAYFTALRIPEHKIGKWKIKHEVRKAGMEMTVYSMRDALFQGRKASCTILGEDVIEHNLYEGGQRWMSDSPQETVQMDECVKPCKGKVLVGGLGLGYTVIALQRKRTLVKKIVVVEKSKAVIDLVWPHLPKERVQMVHGDLFKYLRESKKKRRFDWAIYDIWAPTGERVLTSHIRPLRSLSQDVVPDNHITCWGEETMLGQVRFNLRTAIMTFGQGPPLDTLSQMPEKQFIEMRKFTETQWPFFNWLRKTRVSKEDATALINHYCYAFPRPWEWEKHWKEYA